MAAVLMIGALPGASAAAAEKGPKTETALKEMLAGSQSVKTKDQSEPFDQHTLMIKYKTPISATAHQKAGGRLVQRVSGLSCYIVKPSGKTSLENSKVNYGIIKAQY